MAWLLPAVCSVPASARPAQQAAHAFAWHPRTLFHLRPGVDDVAFDGARVALATRAPGARLDLRDLSGRLIGHAALPGGERLGLIAFGGTSAVVNQITLVGNSEIGGRWVLARPGAPFRVLRRYHSTHEGAGGACCAVVAGSGAAAQGTVVAYALLGTVYRVGGRPLGRDRSRGDARVGGQRAADPRPAREPPPRSPRSRREGAVRPGRRLRPGRRRSWAPRCRAIAPCRPSRARARRRRAPCSTSTG